MLRVVDGVTNRPLVTENFVVVATGHALVTKEVDVLVVDTGNLLFGLEVAQAVCLVPTSRENVKGDLAANGVTGYC